MFVWLFDFYDYPDAIKERMGERLVSLTHSNQESRRVNGVLSDMLDFLSDVDRVPTADEVDTIFDQAIESSDS
jgi:hypothetical protein